MNSTFAICKNFNTLKTSCSNTCAYYKRGTGHHSRQPHINPVPDISKNVTHSTLFLSLNFYYQKLYFPLLQFSFLFLEKLSVFSSLQWVGEGVINSNWKWPSICFPLLNLRPSLSWTPPSPATILTISNIQVRYFYTYVISC